MKRAWLACVAIVAACSGESASTGHGQSGSLTLNLSAADSTAGAIVLTISGGPVTSVVPIGDYQVAADSDATGTHVMIIGNLTPGHLATVTIPDATLSRAYVVTVDQVADRSGFGLLDPASDRAVLVVP